MRSFFDLANLACSSNCSVISVRPAENKKQVNATKRRQIAHIVARAAKIVAHAVRNDVYDLWGYFKRMPVAIPAAYSCVGFVLYALHIRKMVEKVSAG